MRLPPSSTMAMNMFQLFLTASCSAAAAIRLARARVRAFLSASMCSISVTGSRYSGEIKVLRPAVLALGAMKVLGIVQSLAVVREANSLDQPDLVALVNP